MKGKVLSLAGLVLRAWAQVTIDVAVVRAIHRLAGAAASRARR